MVRAAAVGAAFAGGALLGALFQARSVERSRLGTALMLLLVLPLLGALIGMFASLGFVGRWYFSIMLADGAQVGALGALATLPLIALTVRAARRASQARPGSVVHEIERRALWTLPCAAIALGAPFAILGNPESRYLDFDGEVASFCIGLGATLSLVVTLVQALGAARYAAGVWATASELRPRETDTLHDDSSIPRIDLGVGEGELEHYRSPGVAYRSAGGVQSIVRGDPMRALSIARRAAIQTGVALTVAFGATTAAALGLFG